MERSTVFSATERKVRRENTQKPGKIVNDRGVVCVWEGVGDARELFGWEKQEEGGVRLGRVTIFWRRDEQDTRRARAGVIRRAGRHDKGGGR